jgi:hypothetical protein
MKGAKKKKHFMEFAGRRALVGAGGWVADCKIVLRGGL